MNDPATNRYDQSGDELVVLSASSRGALVEKLEALYKSNAKNNAPSLGELSDRLAEAPAGSHRVALIANGPDDLTAKAEKAAVRLASSEKSRFNLANQIFFGEVEDGSGPQKVAFLFPGFGAHHATLMEDLYHYFPAVREWFDGLAAESRARLLNNNLLFSPAIPNSTEAREASGFAETIEAVLAMNLAMYVLLDTHLPDLRCDAMAGHSYGENAMLVASGMVKDHEQVFNLADHILTAVRALNPDTLRAATDVTMLAVTATSRHTLEEICRGGTSPVTLALDNCPQQTILCGKNDEVARIEELLKQRGEICFRIPELTIPVHTQFFPVPDDELRRIYDRIEITPPGARAYSCAAVAPFPRQPQEIRDMLVAQWSAPVRFRETIERLYAEGIRIFVEVGPGGRLTGFTRDILRGSDALAIATNIEGKEVLSQLRVFLAQLFVRGYSVNPAAFRCDRPQPPTTQSREPSHAPAIEPHGQSLVEDVLAEVARVMGVDDIDLIRPQQGFFEMGMNSIQMVELVEKLQTRLNRPLPQTLPFDYPSVEKLAAFLDRSEPAIVTSLKVSPLNDLRPDRIAIVGTGCRFPGKAASPAAFWELLRLGRDAIIETPAGRWNSDEIDACGFDSSNFSHILKGGFLDDVAGFDPAFFGISPREALTLDPQQRLLLEVTWEALENAAINPQALKDTSTGVFVGISNNDYAQRLTMRQRLAINGYLGTGNSHSTAAGRISFVLGLTGPCLAVDTACSSSLVAVHLACKSLQRGESDVAIAGGVNLLISAETSIYLSLAGALSKESRCKVFDAAADGYARGEGCGVVVLKRLSDALAAGDQVLAVILGSAINHDGRTSGFTVPRGPSQQEVIRRALADAGVSADRIDYLETHGTGTSLGDPIEVNALGGVFGGARPATDPLILGSVKTNVGHLEASAGMAGIIKVLLQMQHRQIVPSLHFQTPNPKIDWENLPFAVCNQTQPWTNPGRLLTAGISSFGISGTNSHVILQEPEKDFNLPRSLRSHHILTLSARSEPALKAMAASYSTFLSENMDSDLGDICYTSNIGRAHFQNRMAIVADSLEEAVDELERGPVASSPGRPKVAFLFSGQGSQYINMGRRLFDSEPVFREAIERCSELFRSHHDMPLTDVLFRDGSQENEPPLIDQTAYTQPALFSIEYALTRLWKNWGIEPDAVMGHSVGEYVAACVAGVFSLEEGMKLVAARGRLMQSLPTGGQMLAVKASESEVNRHLNGGRIGVSIAAINGEQNVVLSGPGRAIDEARQALSSQGVISKRLKVSHAFHSSLMDPILEDFNRVAAGVTYRAPQIPIALNLSGGLANSEILSADYWTAQLRRAVRFADGLRALLGQGCNTFLEIGPKPVLTVMGQEELQVEGAIWLASLHPPADETQQMLDSLARLYVNGIGVDWASFHSGRRGRKTVLPTYPFQRERFWIETENLPESPQGHARPAGRAQNILGNRLSLPDPEQCVRFETHVSTATFPFLEDYQVFGRSALPVSCFLAALETAGKLLSQAEGQSVGSFTLHKPLLLEPGAPVTLHTVIHPASEGGRRCGVFSSQGANGGRDRSWELHVESELGESYARGGDLPNERNLFHDADMARLEPGLFYKLCKQNGVYYGARFQVITDLRIGDDRASAIITLPPTLADEAQEYEIHPAMLEGCFQTLGAMLFRRGGYYTISSVARFTAFRASAAELLALVSCATSDQNEGVITANVTLVDQARDRVVARLEGIRCAKVQADPIQVSASNKSSTASRIVLKLRSASDDKRADMLGDYLQKTLATILGAPNTQALNRDLSFSQMGLDSLMALHLRNELRTDFGFDVSAAKLMDGQTLADLTLNVLQYLFAPADAETRAQEESAKPVWVEGEL